MYLKVSAPAPPSNITALTIAENNTIVANIKGGDTSGIEYTVFPSADGPKFTVDASGNLTFVVAPNFEAPNDVGGTAGDNIYRVTVAAADQSGNSSVRTYNVTVTNVNEAPTITSAATGSFAENTSGVVYTAAATDPEGSGVTYEIAGGADASLFTIDPATGALTLTAAQNFEAPGDQGANRGYEVVIAAKDASNNTSTQLVTLTLTDANEAPTGVSLTDPVTALSALAVTTPGIKLGTISVQDDAPGAYTYSVTGADAALVQIVGTDVFLRSGAQLNTVTDGFLDFIIGVDDPLFFGSPDASQAFQVALTPVTATITGTTGNNNPLNGTANADVIFGLAGDDFVLGQGGNDILELGTGNDRGYGGIGDDTIFGREGNDIIYGEAGADTVDGGAGNDTILGAADGAADVMIGGAGNDVIYVYEALDVAYENVGEGTDTLLSDFVGTYVVGAGQSFETIRAVSPGSTTAINLTGNEFGQTMQGNAGANILDGAGGADIISALGGNDTLIGGAGNDRLIGGTGSDTFVFASGFDVDTIADFEVGIDQIDLSAFAGLAFNQLTISEASNGVTISSIVDGFGSIVISNLTTTPVNFQDDFTFGT
jgi:Ca2+-binding RTX toxin-like protein